MVKREICEGVWIFEKALSPIIQEELIALYDLVKKRGYFITPVLKSGYAMSLDMACFGKYWSAVDYKYHDIYVDHHKVPVEPVPSQLIEVAKNYSLEVFPNHDPNWDLAIVNFYRNHSKLGLHVDNSESKETLTTGHPVVSFSVGNSCEFLLGGLSRKSPTTSIVLESGDVLIFGGCSRLRYHGVGKLIPETSPEFCKTLGPGRLNFTLRKM